MVDDRVFLIAAAITAYQDRKSKDVRQLNVASQWKKIGRKLTMRI
jgi:acetyl-CoA carboxylase biotin carboxylase subunit